MDLGFADPIWQSHSSLYREVRLAKEARPDSEKLNHISSALLSSTILLEAFINSEMKEYLLREKSYIEMQDILRKEQFFAKLSRWPQKILETAPKVSDDCLRRLKRFYGLRCDIVHARKLGPIIYKDLAALSPDELANTCAEYIISFLESKNNRYPYWLTGWNYLDPRIQSPQIVVINNQQFIHSLMNIGVDVNAWDSRTASQWEEEFMSNYSGYQRLTSMLSRLDRCEPKSRAFPVKPTLCQAWWTPDHQRICGARASA